jgi:hypothetical protein
VTSIVTDVDVTREVVLSDTVNVTLLVVLGVVWGNMRTLSNEELVAQSRESRAGSNWMHSHSKKSTGLMPIAGDTSISVLPEAFRTSDEPAMTDREGPPSMMATSSERTIVTSRAAVVEAPEPAKVLVSRIE